MKHRNFLNLDIHTQDEGRCLVQIGIDSLTPAERRSLFELFRQETEGRSISIAVDLPEGTEAGEAVLKFTFARMAYAA